MVAIDDINKLAPDLLKKSKAQLEREITERQMAMAEIQRQEEIKAKEELAAQANQHIEAIVTGLNFLHDNGALPPKVQEAFTRADGRFVPATYLRAVTAESLVPGTPRRSRSSDGPKRRRRVRDPKTGELVPSKAAQAAGEV